MGCECTSAPAPSASAPGRASSAPRGPAATTTRRPSRSTPRSRSRRPATWWWPRSALSTAAATVAVNAIHLDRVPEFDYDLLWWERSLRSVANVTRDDAREFLDLAVRIPVTTHTEVHPLADANLALARLSAGRVDGAAVLVTGS